MKVSVILASCQTKSALDGVMARLPKAEVRVIDPAAFEDIFPAGQYHDRHMHDYYKVKKMLDMPGDIVIGLDPGLRIVSDDFSVLPRLTERFGLCLVSSPRRLVRVDTMVGVDSDGEIDRTNGCGYAYSPAIVAINLKYRRAASVAAYYCDYLLKNPVRASLAWWRTAWAMGFSPYILPPEWCVGERDIGCGNEIVINEASTKVKDHYAHVGWQTSPDAAGVPAHQ